MDWFRPSVILALLFRKNTTKHTIIATEVTTEVSNEINAITMAAIVATSFRYLLEAGTTTGKRDLQ